MRLKDFASHAEGVILDPKGNPAAKRKCRQAQIRLLRKGVRIWVLIYFQPSGAIQLMYGYGNLEEYFRIVGLNLFHFIRLKASNYSKNWYRLLKM